MFLKNLIDNTEEIDDMFDDLVGKLIEVLPDFGRYLEVDGKAIDTHARGRKKDEEGKEPDGRRDIDAKLGDEGISWFTGGW